MIYIILIVAFLLLSGAGNNTEIVLDEIEVKPDNKVDNKPVEKLCKQIYDKYFSIVSNTIKSNNLKITPIQALATIRQESGSQSISKENSAILGDKGKSIGVMQIYPPSLADTNRVYHTNYSLTDRNNLTINVEIGCKYLDMCYKSALKTTTSNPIKLAYKKYNGGIDETDTSLNLMASDYSYSAYNFYLEMTKI